MMRLSRPDAAELFMDCLELAFAQNGASYQEFANWRAPQHCQSILVLQAKNCMKIGKARFKWHYPS